MNRNVLFNNEIGRYNSLISEMKLRFWAYDNDSLSQSCYKFKVICEGITKKDISYVAQIVNEMGIDKYDLLNRYYSEVPKNAIDINELCEFQRSQHDLKHFIGNSVWEPFGERDIDRQCVDENQILAVQLFSSENAYGCDCDDT